MISDERITLLALKYICGEHNSLCRLCLSPTENEGIAIKGIVRVKTSYYEEFVSYLTMLQKLDVAMETLLPQVLCKNCATVVINCYLFQRLLKFSNQKWYSILKTLDEATLQSSILKFPKAYGSLIINTNEKQIYKSRLNCNNKAKKECLIRVIRIMDKHENNKGKHKVCEACGRIFESRIQLLKHMNAHHSSVHPCPQCLKKFRLKLHLAEHNERVHYPKKIQCKQCLQKFSTNRILKYHIRREHVVVKCKQCNIDFPSRKTLKVHLYNHSTHTCPQCKKQYTNGQYFKLHIKKCGVKENIKKYICDLCNKIYSHKHSLGSHMKTEHGFGEVIECQWCSKKFGAISKLEDHIVTHTKEKKFNCEMCGLHFVSQKSLTNHIRLHTGEKPYPCNLCNKSFLSASRRLEHQKRIHFEPTQECSVCHAKFVTIFDMRKHRERHFNPRSRLYVSPSTVQNQMNKGSY